MRKSERTWFRGLIGGAISAACSAGAGFAGISAAHGAGVDVQAMNLKGLGILLLTSGLVSAMSYLSKSPLPPDDDTTVLVKQTVRQEQISPTIQVETKIQETSKVHSDTQNE